MKRVTRKVITEFIEKVLEDSDVEVSLLDPAGMLDAQGVDSLDMMNIIFQIQDDYSIEISEDSLEEGKWLTIDKIVESLNEML